MNLGMFAGTTPPAELVATLTVGMEVVTASGDYVSKGQNLEITLVGAGDAGVRNANGGAGSGTVIKRIVGLPVGTILAVVIGAGGTESTPTGGISTCSIPGYPVLTAGATPAGGDLNIAGSTGQGIDQNGGGGFGGNSMLGFGGRPTTTGSGFGSGGGAGTTAVAPGQGRPGAMVVRYF